MNPKVVFLDLEGTLLQNAYSDRPGHVSASAWPLIAKVLGPEAEKEELATQERNARDEYSGYVEWMRDTIRIHQKYGLTRELFCRTLDSLELMRGAHEFVAECKAWGATTALLTGSFKYLADRVQRELQIDHSFAACEYFFNERTGELEHFNLLPSDFFGKVDFMKIIMKEHGATPVECAFVGDGKNDVYLAREVYTSVAFNAEPTLKEAATYVVEPGPDGPDLRDVLPILESSKPLKEFGNIRPRISGAATNLDKRGIIELWKHAFSARRRAYAPYSGFSVGAAVLTDDGHIFTGSNVENASFGATNCAERSAIFAAVHAGFKKIKALSVIGDAPEPLSPCGICRQVMSEFGRGATIIMGNTAGLIQVSSLEDLLPYAFTLDKKKLKP